MEIPENLRELVDRLGQSLVQALVNDPQSRELARLIQESGFEIALMLEATVALRPRNGGEEDSEAEEAGEAGEAVERDAPPESAGLPESEEQEPFRTRELPPLPGARARTREPSAVPEWSEADKAFLKTFKISFE